MRCFDVEFWGGGMELHFDGEETAIVVCGDDTGIMIRTWTYPRDPGSDMPVLNIFNYYDLELNDDGDGLLLETNAKDYIVGRIG